MRHRLREAERNAPLAACAYGSEARLERVLRRFNIRAEALLELVSDIDMQNAVIAILDSLERGAWEEQTGAPPEVMRPASTRAEANLDSIHERVQHWIGEGYKRLELLGGAGLRPEGQAASKASGAAAAPPSPAGVMNTGDGNDSDRRAALDTISNSATPAVVASASPQKAKRYPRTALQATRWEEIQISFLSEFKVEIRTSQGEFEAWNYGELGFEDRRNGNPNLVWQVFRSLAESGGSIRDPGELAHTWPVIEKRVQRLRAFLRHFFNLPDDPLPLAEGNGYRARFTIRCRPAYNT